MNGSVCEDSQKKRVYANIDELEKAVSIDLCFLSRKTYISGGHYVLED